MKHRGWRAVVAGIGTATLLLSPSPSASAAPDEPPLTTVVTVTADVRATVQFNDDAVPDSARDAHVTVTCLGVAIAPRRVITSATCTDVNTLSMRSRLRTAAIDDLAGLTTSEVERLQRKATAEQWRVSGPTDTLLTADFRVNRPRDGGEPSTPVQLVSHRQEDRVAILESDAPLAEDVARVSPTPPATGAMVRVAILASASSAQTKTGGALVPRIVKSSNGRSLTVGGGSVNTGSRPLSAGSPIFDSDGRLVGLAVSEFAAPALGVSSLEWILADIGDSPTAATPRTPPSQPSVPSPDPQAADNDATTAAGGPSDSAEGLSTWAKIAIGFGAVDVLVLILVVVVLARRRR